MRMSEMFPSSFLKKEDVPHPVTAVIDSVTMQDVNTEGGKESKVVLSFRGDLKEMIVNKGNAIVLSESFGDDSDNWVGKTVEVYTDPSVMFGGKRVGGLRIRIPSQRQSSPVATASGPLWDYSDGQSVTKGKTTQEVLDDLADMESMGAQAGSIRIRPSGSKETPVSADVWKAAHAPAVAPDGSPIPF